MSKIEANVVAEVIQAQTEDPSKSKGKEKKGSGFFWEAYQPAPQGKRGIMTQWDKEIRASMNWNLEFDKDGRITARHPVQNARKIAANAAKQLAAEAKAKKAAKGKK